MPRCASIDDQPAVMAPVHHSCIGCSNNNLGSKCKPKVRLLVLTWVTEQPTLVVFNLSPTSIKRWRMHVNKLARSNAPYIAVVTKFSLEDTSKNSFRWAEVSMNVERVVTKEELDGAMSIRDQFKVQFGDVDDADYSDPGDKVEEA